MIMYKLRSFSDMLGEFWAHSLHFLACIVGRNHFINTKFTKHIMEIANSSDVCVGRDDDVVMEKCEFNGRSYRESEKKAQSHGHLKLPEESLKGSRTTPTATGDSLHRAR